MDNHTSSRVKQKEEVRMHTETLKTNKFDHPLTK